MILSLLLLLNIEEPLNTILREFNNDIKLLDERIITVENTFEDDDDIHESNTDIDLARSRLISQQAIINLIVQEQMTDQCKFTPRNLMNERRFANTLFDKNVRTKRYYSTIVMTIVMPPSPTTTMTLTPMKNMVMSNGQT